MVLHERAMLLAKDFKKAESELLAVLVEMKKSRAFETLGYPGVFDYVTRCLKLGEAQAFYFQKVVQKSIEVPALQQAVMSGDLSLSQARRIVPVLTQSSAEEWIEKAKAMKQRELEREVAKVNPAAKVRERIKPVGPRLVQMVVSLTPEVERLLNRVRELESQRLKKNATWNEALETMAKEYLERHDPIERAKRLSSRKGNASPATPGRRPIPANVKHQVALRDGGQCTAAMADGTRCTSRRWLELDHIVPVHSGGLNIAENLRTLCSFHHQRRHTASNQGVPRRYRSVS